MHLSLRPKAWARMWRIWLAPSLGGLSCYPLCINVGSVSETSTLFAYTVLNDYAVFSQRWRSQYVSVMCSFLTTFVLPLRSDEAVSVCARYLLCPLTTLMLSGKPVSVCARYLLCPLTKLSRCARHAVCSSRLSELPVVTDERLGQRKPCVTQATKIIMVPTRIRFWITPLFCA